MGCGAGLFPKWSMVTVLSAGRAEQIAGDGGLSVHSLSDSDLAAVRMGMLVSASFHALRKS